MSDGKENNKDGLMHFVDEDASNTYEHEKLVWRVLIIDDEKDVHSATTFALRSTQVMGRPLEFLHATSAREAKRLLTEQKDIAVILLDVVMETPNAGLDLVPMIRNELEIKDTRIILRTGQPNQAPEIEVIRDYDINDYRLKSELTQARLYASLTTAIRSYKQIQTIETSKRSLAMIVKASAELLTHQGIRNFAEGVILHLSGLLSISPEGLICVRRHGPEAGETRIIAAAGNFDAMIDKSLSELDVNDVRNILDECLSERKNIFGVSGIALYLGCRDGCDMACFVSSDAEISEVDEHLIELFCSNIIICANNLGLVSKLNEAAYIDHVTELPNRNSLVKEIDSFRSEPADDPHALCVLDIDNFAEVSASLGETYGDDLLKVVGKRLLEHFPKPCFVARISADIFAVFGPESSLNKDSLLAPFSSSFEIEGEEQILSVTIGVVPFEEIDGGGEDAVKDAIIVLKTAKNQSRGDAVRFRREMVKSAQDRLDMLHRLRIAFENEELFLMFQPKLHLETMRVDGFEALVRWRDAQGNFIPPTTFIPIAEQSGLMVRLGNWIYRQSLINLRAIHEAGWKDTQISINLSIAQLQSMNIVEVLQSGLEEIGIDPKYVQLEVTESFAITDLESTLALLNRFKTLGFTLALDDFGAGYSSLKHLQKLPIDVLKLDKSLMDSVGSQEGREVLDGIVQLACRFGMSLVAEGVEVKEQEDFLKSIKCTDVQGFLYAKPMEKDTLLDWLSSRKN